MAKRIVYTCDFCMEEGDEDGKDNTQDMELWLHLNCSFIKKISEGHVTVEDKEINDKAMMGDFCSAQCLKNFVEKRSKLSRKNKPVKKS